MLNRTALLLDVDGVVTDEFAVIDHGVIGMLRALGRAGHPLAFVTGRSREWVQRCLAPALESGDAADSAWLGAVTISAEMGAHRSVGAACTDWETDRHLAVPEDLRAELRAVTAHPRYRGALEWDATKTVNITVEGVHHPGNQVLRARSAAALRDWHDEIAPRVGPDHDIRTSTYAVDVVCTSLTKAVGAGFALDRFGRLGGPSRVIVFGDSAADAAMADSALARGAAVTFAWLGGGAPPRMAPGIETVVPPRPFAAGTSAVLGGLLGASEPPVGGAG